MRTFRAFIKEAIAHQAGSSSTQVATTGGSYRKSAGLLGSLKAGDKVLDYGAGRGLGTAEMQKALPHAEVHSYEPGAKGWSPTHSSSDTITHTYPAVVSLNVLNVLEPKLRSEVTKHLLSTVRVGGTVIIGVRKAKGDVLNAKNATPAKEPGAIWVHKAGGQDVYQKGFDGNELVEYLESQDSAGDFEFTRISGVAATSVMGTRIR